MNVLLDPNSVFIDELTWNNEIERDNFLTDLFDIIDAISDTKKSVTFWTEELETILWNSPQLNPWKSINNYKFSLIPIIYTKLRSKYLYVDISDNSCTTNPEISYSYTNAEIREIFLRTSDSLLQNNVEFFFFLSIPNKLLDEIKFSGVMNDYVPKLLKEKSCYYKRIPFFMDYWPLNTTNIEIKKFTKCLDIIRLIEFPNKKWLYQFDYLESFTKSILDLHENKRYNLLLKCAKRLCYSNAESQVDGVLQDEYIVQSKERRFRVSSRPTSQRIHYDFNERVFVFIKFYNVGEHDDAL